MAKEFSSRRFLLENAVYIVLMFLLVIACIKILLPFLVALTWSVIILISVWPLYQFFCKKFGNWPKLCALLVMCLLTVALIMPLALMVMALIDMLPTLSRVANQLAHYTLPASPPAWVRDTPILGKQLAYLWQRTHTDLFELFSRTQPLIQDVLSWSLQQGAQLIRGVLEISLAIVIAGILLVSGEKLWHCVQEMLVRISGKNYADVPMVVVRTIRGVATGVIGTALMQAFLVTLGFFIAGVPGALALGFACLIFAVAQLPTILVWGPAVAWLFVQHELTMAIFLGLWGLLLVSTVDNFFKPYLISYGAGMPLSLIFLGVFGGLLSMGIIGLFLGPTILAIAYTLIVHWLKTPINAHDDK